MHILVIRLSAMGDVAMTVPILSTVLRQNPGLKITVLTKPFFSPIFFELEGVRIFTADVDERHKGLFGLYRLFRELRCLDIDAVADLHHVLRSSVLKVFFRFSDIPFIQIDKGRAEKKALTVAKNKIFKPLKTTHQRYADVFAALQLPIDLNQATLLPTAPLSKAIQNAVGEHDLKWIGVAPFAAFAGKTYPKQAMLETLKQLSASNTYKIILFGGGNGEAGQLDQWALKHDNWINIAGKFSFAEELNLISNLDLMLSMDSGNGHLAAMYGIPVVTLWGVTHPYAGFSPFGQPAGYSLVSNREKYPLIPTSVYGNKLPEGYENVMQTIKPESRSSKNFRDFRMKAVFA